MSSIEADGNGAPNIQLASLASDGGEAWKCWNRHSEVEHTRPAAPPSPSLMISTAESGSSSSTSASEPLVLAESSLDFHIPSMTSLRDEAATPNTFGGVSSQSEALQDDVIDGPDSDVSILVSDIPCDSIAPTPSITTSALPGKIRTLIDEWYDRHGHQKPPPCAVTLSKRRTLRCDHKGRPATYTHKNGELLAVDMFALPEFDNTNVSRKHILVAYGPKLGTVAIAYHCNNGRGKGLHVTQYRIWEGTNSQDPNGWEESVSVRKRLSSVNVENAGETDIEKEDLADDSDRESSQMLSRPSTQLSKSPVRQNVIEAWPRNNNDILQIPPSSRIPTKIRKSINEWCLLQGPGHLLPFVVTNKDYNFTSSSSGRSAYFKHDDGTRLNISMYPLDSQRPQDQGYHVIIANGQNSGPYLIMASNTGEGRGRSGCVYYFNWIGINGDVNGFADTFTIAKYFGAPIKNKYKESSSKHLPRPNGKADTSTVLTSPSKRLKVAASPARATDGLPGFHEHVWNNAVLLFFSASNQTPRMRLFGTCDRVQKLFAQALAGDLFDENKKGPKILSIVLVGQEKACKVVEDDEDDFDDLISAVRRLDCWSITEGRIKGSCTIEVRGLS